MIWKDDKNLVKILEMITHSRVNVSVVSAVDMGTISFIAELFNQSEFHFCLVSPSRKKSVEIAKNLRFFLSEKGKAMLAQVSNQNEPVPSSSSNGEVILFPSLSQIPDQENPSLYKAFKTHLIASSNALIEREKTFSVVPSDLFFNEIKYLLDNRSSKLSVSAGEEIDVRNLVKLLSDFGYERSKRVENDGEFSFRGGILDIFIPLYSMPVRIELFGDEIVSIREFDPLTQRSISRVKKIGIVPLNETEQEDRTYRKFYDQFIKLYPQNHVILYFDSDQTEKELMGLTNQVFDCEEWEQWPGKNKIFTHPFETAKEYKEKEIVLNVQGVQFKKGDLNGFVRNLFGWMDKDFNVQIIYRKESFRRLLEERIADAEINQTFNLSPSKSHKEKIEFQSGIITKGFKIPHLKRVFISESDIIGTKKKQLWRKTEPDDLGLSFGELKSGDHIVHIDHGIGRYHGLIRLDVNGKPRDFLHLIYANGQKLYLPVERLDLVQRYIASKGFAPILDKLGGTSFAKKKKKVKESILKLAAELLQIFSIREVSQGYQFPPDETFQREFELGFDYDETPDQIKAIHEVKADMEKNKPMDRLVCGDVGYGKTEVAMRAAFKSAINNKQVAVLVPTTILAQQHFNTFSNRFSNFPLNIAMLSRFLKPADSKRVKDRIKNGMIDIVVGTHALLAENVKFRDLGLLVIDEEQRFGVKHKEKLKQLRKEVDVLTLTATPIPRTLNLAMLDLRDISLINTAPEARRPIATKVTKFDLNLIRNAILNEINRGGQVYFVHNRIQSIFALNNMLEQLVPEASFRIAHGQMSENKLEKIMLEFLEKEFDVLVSTTIIESGLDIPSVNTILINRADRLGLAQLYQLRGRVGRDRYQAYAYLLIPTTSAISEKARERLMAIKDAVELGSGFKLATHDLEIRGAGDVLGPNQHGHISAVGFDMYCQMMREAIHELRGSIDKTHFSTDIQLGMDTAVPSDYISDTSERLAVYRRFATIKDRESLAVYYAELQDRYGIYPIQIENLNRQAEIRLKAEELKVNKIEKQKRRIKIVFNEKTPVQPVKITALLKNNRGIIDFDPPDTLFLNSDEENYFVETKNLLDNLLA